MKALVGTTFENESEIDQLCQELNVPCVALAGSIGEGIEPAFSQGLTACFPITPGPMTLTDAMIHAPALLALTAENVLRLFTAKCFS